MIWLTPTALFALAAVAAPMLIHLLIQRRAERLPFPTLRFLQPTRLASIRRHLIDDLPLLAIRAALLAAAAAALAGPLLVTGARRQAWDRRIARAVVADDGARAFQPGDRPFLQRRFDAISIADGIRGAAFWLAAAPPARREIVIASPFPIGSITQADVDAIPADIGVRFERSGTLPAMRTVAGGRLFTAEGVLARDVTLAGNRTSVRETLSFTTEVWPIDVMATPGDRPAIDAAMSAVRSQHVWTAPADRRARLAVVRAVADVAVIADAAPIRQPWMADAVASIAGDRDLTSAAARVPAGLADARWESAPWQILATAADGHPLMAAAGAASGVIVVSAAPAADLATPVLIRSMANAIAAVPDLRWAEVTPIADAMLQRWSRPAAPVTAPRVETVDQDDRRWLWLAVLTLLGLEMWVRRARAIDEPRAVRGEDARVA